LTDDRVELTAASAARLLPSPPRTRLAVAWKRFRANRGATIGVVILAALLVCAALASYLAPRDPIAVAPRDRLLGPSRHHLMGTDTFGRDVFSRVIHGSRLSLTLGVISVGIAGTAGTLLGLTAAYYGGHVDRTATLLTDVMLAFPGILLALTISTALGPGLRNAMLAVGIASVPQYIRVVRGSVLTVKALTYVEAAQAAGCGSRRIMLRHILPNIIAPVIVLASIGIGSAILVGAAISFIGLGSQPPTPEWGTMVGDGRGHIRNAWWISGFPGLAIMITVLAMNMIGDGLRVALDPRLGE
jgi:peptide/nickel transport system permease protein